MTITFNDISADIRTPGVHVEVDNTNALQGLLPWRQRICMFGQMSSEGTATSGTLYAVPTTEEGQSLFGVGSVLARMVKAFKEANPYTELYAIPQANDVGTGTPQATVLVNSAATGDGTLYLLVGGQPVYVPVTSGDSAQDIADAIKAVISDTNHQWLPVTCTDSLTATAKLDYKSYGLVGNDLDVRVNYYPGQKYPAGVTVTITLPSEGTANPSLDFSTLLGDEDFQYIILPYNDATNLADLEGELERRFGPMVQMQGIGFYAVKGTQAVLDTWCEDNSRNCPHLSSMGWNDAPGTSEEWAAVYGAIASRNLNIDPARPLQTLPLTGILPPSEGSVARATREERDVRLWAGMSTWTVDAGGRVLIERAITNYRLNATGVPDPSYLDVNTMATLAYTRYQWRNRMLLKFPRHKLADDTTVVPPGQYIARPKDVKMETIAVFADMADVGIIENLEELKAVIICERNISDRNRVDILIPCDLVNQFRILTGKLQFIL